MANISKAQERALSLAFRVVGAPEEQQRRIRDELAKHGVVRDTAKDWFAILDSLDESTRNLARFEIRVDSAAAQLARSAARFAEQPSQPQSPQTETRPAEPVSEIPPVPEIDTEAVNAWFEETGIKDIDAVKGLDPARQDTLARIAQINRRIAYLLVTYQPLINIAGPGELLDRVRTLMKLGSRDWTRLFDDTGLFSKEPRFIRRALRILDAAARTAATTSARGLKIKSSVANIQWPSLPQEARIYMERRLRPYIDKQTAPIETMARTTTVDIISPGDEVVEVITASRASPAFGISDTKEFFARRQIRPFQLLLAAKMAGAKSVRFLLYGEPIFDEKYAEKLLETARELQLGIVIIHADQSTGEARYLFGETAARPEPKGSPIRRLPPLSMPRSFKMKAPPLAHEDAATPVPAKEERKFADHFKAELGSGVDAVVQWALAMRRSNTDLTLPSTVRDVVGELLGEGGRSVSPESGLQMLDKTILGRMEVMFSYLDRTDDATKALLERVSERSEPQTFDEAYAARDDLEDDHEEFKQLRLDLKDLDHGAGILDKICKLIHPLRVGGLLSGTATDLMDLYVEAYLEIEERLRSIETRLSAAEAGLSEAMMSISVRDFLTSARGKIEKAEETTTALRKGVTNARRFADKLFTAARRTDLSPYHLLDTASRAHDHFPELAGVAALSKEIAGLGETAHYRYIVEGDPIFTKELERVWVVAEMLLVDMSVIQSQYDSAKGEHAIEAAKQRQGARNLELLLEPTGDTGLPPPLNVTEFGSRQIEGVGDLRLKRGSEVMRQRVSRRDKSFEPFNSARALIVRGKNYLVDANAVGAVSKWLGQRNSVLILRDMLGQRIEIPQHYYGVRMVKVNDLPKEHPFARISAVISARYCLSTTAMDLMLALFSGLPDQGTAELWKRFLSTAAKIMQDSVSNDGEGNLLDEVVIRLRIDRAILSLYEGILEIPALASFADRWFRFGDLDATVRGDFSPIPEGVLTGLEQMSLEDMARVIEATGLLPVEEKDRLAWVSDWLRAVEGRSPKSLARTWKGFAGWFERIQKRAKHLPEPFKFVGAMVEKADDEGVLVLRMIAQGFLAEEAAGRRMDDTALVRFAIKFLAGHQSVIADILREKVRSEIDELQWNDVRPTLLLAKREAFAGHDVGYLAALGREFLKLRGSLTDQTKEILGDAVAAMFGRLLLHRDALTIFHFSWLISNEAKDLPNTQDFLAGDDLANEFLGPQTVIDEVFERFSFRWPHFEQLLKLVPIELDKLNADIDRAIELAKGGVSGGGAPSGGGGSTTSGSEPGSELGGFEPVDEGEGDRTTASSEGLSDGAEFYLQMGMDATGSPLGGITPMVMPIRPVTVF